MSAKPSREEEITDSTDWLATPLPKLSSVEAALRCQVCKEFFRTPMITSCSHTFCSICIRRCLNNDNRCPACRAEDQELKLRSNWAMEEMVDAFTKARPEVLEFARRSIDPGSPKRKRGPVEQVVEGSPMSKRTRSSGRTVQPKVTTVTILDSDGEEDEDYIPEDGRVPCPICQERMTEKEVQIHIDSCDGVPPSRRKAASSAQNPIINQSLPTSKSIKRPEKLPHPHFPGMKDPLLRKKLQDLGISAWGSRKAQEDRLKEWILIWNSNCDNKNPRSKSELRKDLDKWEHTQGDRASTSSLAHATGIKIKDKDFDGKEWASEHSDTFVDLVAQARSKLKAKKEEADKSQQSGSSMLPAPTESNPLPAIAPPPVPLYMPPQTSLPSRPDPTHPYSLSQPQMPQTNCNPTPQRYFQEPNTDSFMLPPSSQNERLPQKMDGDTGLDSDISTVRALQP